VRGTRHVSAWWIFATGVLWLGIGGALGLGALAVALLPGSLITAGGVRLLLASDVRSPQLAALGSALGVLAAPLVVWAAGGGWAIGALLASAASFVAVGWTALALEPELEEVPTPAPTPGYAAKAALDDTLMSLMTLSHRPPDRSQLRHNAEELLRCHELLNARAPAASTMSTCASTVATSLTPNSPAASSGWRSRPIGRRTHSCAATRVPRDPGS
jgi:hypothetical protein